jgi:hypothetical protein
VGGRLSVVYSRSKLLFSQTAPSRKKQRV